MRKPAVIAGSVGLAAGAAAAAARLNAYGHPRAAAGVAGIAAWLTIGTYAANSGWLGPVTAAGSADRPVAGLTFDDGPGPSTPAVLEALHEAGVRATFFVLGVHARRYPGMIRAIHDAGHQLASHGFDHGILVFRGPRHVRDQLLRTEDAVNGAVGCDVLSPWLRTPHGFRGPATWPAARSAGYRLAGWTAGVWDTAEPGVGVIVRRCETALRGGAVILLHDADGWSTGRPRPQTAAAIPGICAAARRRGLALATFDDVVVAA